MNQGIYYKIQKKRNRNIVIILLLISLLVIGTLLTLFFRQATADNTSTVFGNGSNGACTYSSSASLTAEIQCTSLLVSNGVTLNTCGYAILVAGTATINGLITDTCDMAGAGQVGSTTCQACTMFGVAAGGGGGNGGAGGASGGGVAGGSGAGQGGAGGGVVAIAAETITGNGLIDVSGGNGGSGAAGNNGGFGGGGGQGGGGGGGGGSLVMIYLTNSFSGTLRYNGGSGGAAGAGGSSNTGIWREVTQLGNAGSNGQSGGASNGGAGGTGGAGGDCWQNQKCYAGQSGSNGNAGGSGTVKQYQLDTMQITLQPDSGSNTFSGSYTISFSLEGKASTDTIASSGTTVTDYVDANTQYSINACSSGSSNTEYWCLAVSNPVGSTPAGLGYSVTTPSSGSQSVTLYYYDLLPLTTSYQIIDGGSPAAPSITYHTAPSSPSLTDSEQSVSTTLSASPTTQTIWYSRGTNPSVPATIAGGANEQWATLGTSFNPVSYYHQYDQNLYYSVVDGGNPSAPTASGLQYGASVSPTLTTSSSARYWFDAIGSISFSTSTGGTGEQWSPSPASVSATSLQSVDVLMFHQFQENLAYSVIDGGSGYSAPTFSAIQYGNPYTLTLGTSAQTVWLDATQAWSVTNPLSGSGSTEQWSTAMVTSGTITGYNQFSTFNYYNQYLFTLSYSIVGGGTPNAPVLSATQYGGSYGPTLTTTATGYWLDATKGWSVSNPLGGSTTSERWSTLQTTSGTVTGAYTSSLVYYNQYSQIVVTNSFCPNTCPDVFAFTTYGSGSSVNINSQAQTLWLDSGTSATTQRIVSDASGQTYTTTTYSWTITGSNVVTDPIVYTKAISTSFTNTIILPFTQYTKSCVNNDPSGNFGGYESNSAGSLLVFFYSPATGSLIFTQSSGVTTDPTCSGIGYVSSGTTSEYMLWGIVGGYQYININNIATNPSFGSLTTVGCAKNNNALTVFNSNNVGIINYTSSGYRMSASTTVGGCPTSYSATVSVSGLNNIEGVQTITSGSSYPVFVSTNTGISYAMVTCSSSCSSSVLYSQTQPLSSSPLVSGCAAYNSQGSQDVVMFYLNSNNQLIVDQFLGGGQYVTSTIPFAPAGQNPNPVSLGVDCLSLTKLAFLVLDGGTNYLAYAYSVNNVLSFSQWQNIGTASGGLSVTEGAQQYNCQGYNTCGNYELQLSFIDLNSLVNLFVVPIQGITTTFTYASYSTTTVITTTSTSTSTYTSTQFTQTSTTTTSTISTSSIVLVVQPSSTFSQTMVATSTTTVTSIQVNYVSITSPLISISMIVLMMIFTALMFGYIGGSDALVLGFGVGLIDLVVSGILPFPYIFAEAFIFVFLFLKHFRGGPS